MSLFKKLSRSLFSQSNQPSNRCAKGLARRVRTRGLFVEEMEQRRLLAVINLGAIQPNRATLIAGLTAEEMVGTSVSSAGDVNFDDMDDMLISTAVGTTYLTYGGQGDANGNLSWDLSQTAVFESSDPDHACAATASGVGDVNGDRLEDILFGCANADLVTGEQNAGASFLVLSTPSTPFHGHIDITQIQHPRELIGYRGVKIYGANAGDTSGRAVSGAGDVNGDGFPDMLIGAPLADALNDAKLDAGETYIVFGSATLPASIDLGNLGTAGVVLHGAAAGFRSGSQVSGAGDINGDGFDDVIIKSDNEAYVVLGRAVLPRTIDLAQLGAAGIRLYANNSFANSFVSSISKAGDVNGDGFDDLIIGNANAAPRLPGDPGDRVGAGESYLIYGRAALPQTIKLTDLGQQGVRFVGAASRDGSGISVSGGRDFNADGFDDLVIGAHTANAISNPAFQYAGVSYIIFGGASLPAVTDLALQINGIKVSGADGGDVSGRSVSFAGDINYDGFSDVIIGISSSESTGNLKNKAGEVAVIYGRNFYTNSVTHMNGKMSGTLNGTAGADVMVGPNDHLIANGGADVIYGSSVALRSTDFKKIVNQDFHGRLILTGRGMTLDLTTLADNRLNGFNQIDLSGTGDNKLILNKREVLNLHDQDNSLLVRRNFGDTVDLGPGWTQLPNEVIEVVTYEVFQQGNAKVRIESVNRAAIISGFDTPITYTENGQPVVLDNDVTITDVDSPNFDGGRLGVFMLTNGNSSDRFAIRNVGNGANQIGVTGNVITFGGVPIGTFSGTRDLIMPLNANATTLAVQTLLRNITYVNTSDAPSTLTRTVIVNVSDGDGGQNSGFSNRVTKTIRVVAINDAPIISGLRENVTYLRTGSPIRLAPGAIVTDVDNQNFSGGQLTVRTTNNAQPGDRISIHSQGVSLGQIGFDGVSVTFSGIVIGTKVAGSGTSQLMITFNSNATPLAVRALLRQIVWSTNSPTPLPLPRRVIFTLSDGAGGESEVGATRVLVR